MIFYIITTEMVHTFFVLTVLVPTLSVLTDFELSISVLTFFVLTYFVPAFFLHSLLKLLSADLIGIPPSTTFCVATDSVLTFLVSAINELVRLSNFIRSVFVHAL